MACTFLSLRGCVFARERQDGVVCFWRGIGVNESDGDGAEGDFEVGMACVVSQGYLQLGKGASDVVGAVAKFDFAVVSDGACEGVWLVGRNGELFWQGPRAGLVVL